MMSEILSQAEIDELLNAISSGTDAAEAEVDKGPNVKSYDFKTANRFTKDQMRSLEMVFDGYAQMIANQVTNILRVPCECSVLSLEEMSYSEFNNSLPSPVVLCLFSAVPLEGTLLMQISPELGYTIINRLLGGLSASTESSKHFTEIELALIERFLAKTMHVFDEAWEKFIKLRSRLERLETSTQFVQIATPSDATAVGTLAMKVASDEGLISICIPRSAIETVTGQLSPKSLYSASASGSSRERDEQQIQALGEKVGRARVSIVGYFNDTPAKVSDIMSLQVGDVIRLEHKLDEPLRMRVQHIPKFYAKVGVSGAKYALQITDIIEEVAAEDESFTGRN